MEPIELPVTDPAEWTDAEKAQAEAHQRMTQQFLYSGGGNMPRSIQNGGITWLAIQDNDRYKFVPQAGKGFETSYGSTSMNKPFQSINIPETDLSIESLKVTDNPNPQINRRANSKNKTG